MGILQNAINQMIGTAAIAANLDPEAEKRMQIKGLKRDIKDLKEYAFKLEDVGIEEEQNYAEADELLRKKYAELSKLEPTAENIGNMTTYQRYSQQNMRAAAIQEKKSKQRENYSNFVRFITDPTEAESEFKKLTGGNK